MERTEFTEKLLPRLSYPFAIEEVFHIDAANSGSVFFELKNRDVYLLNIRLVQSGKFEADRNTEPNFQRFQQSRKRTTIQEIMNTKGALLSTLERYDNIKYLFLYVEDRSIVQRLHERLGDEFIVPTDAHFIAYDLERAERKLFDHFLENGYSIKPSK